MDDMAAVDELQFPAIEVLLASFNMTYVVENELPIEAIDDKDPRVQAREPDHWAPKNRVGEYAQQMRNGAVFPPILVRSGPTPYPLIDGNTRIAAAKRLGRKTICAIVVDTITERMAGFLAAAVNQQGGERLTSDEAKKQASIMLDEKMDTETVSRYIGYPESTVRKWQREQAGWDRAVKMGLKDLIVPAKEGQKARVSRTTLAKLSSISLEKPFGEVLRLIAETRGVGERQVSEVVAAVQAAESEQDALEVISAFKAELAPCGPIPQLPSRNLRPVYAACGVIIKINGNPSSAFNPAKLVEDLARWEAVTSVAAEVVAAIKKLQ